MITTSGQKVEIDAMDAICKDPWVFEESAMSSSVVNETDDTGRSNSSPFSIQSAALTPRGSLQGLHNMQGNFNIPSMADTDTYYPRNIIPSGSMQQSTGNLVTGRFGSTDLPVVPHQMYQHGLGMSDTERPAYNPRTDIIPSVLPTSAAVPVNLMGNTSSQIAPSMGNQSLHGREFLFSKTITAKDTEKIFTIPSNIRDDIFYGPGDENVIVRKHRNGATIKFHQLDSSTIWNFRFVTSRKKKWFEGKAWEGFMEGQGVRPGDKIEFYKLHLGRRLFLLINLKKRLITEIERTASRESLQMALG